MKCIAVCVTLLAIVVVARAQLDTQPAIVDDSSAAASSLPSTSAVSSSSQQLEGAASSLDPYADKKQEKRYIGYGGVGGYGMDYYNPYSSRLGLDGGYGAGYGSSGYGGYGAGYGTGGYGGYGAGYGGYGAGYGGTGGFGSYAGYGGYQNPVYNSYYSSRFGVPYNRLGYGGYNSYPSSYYSSNYANSIVGGGVGGLGGVPPVPGYQYGPGISGSVY